MDDYRLQHYVLWFHAKSNFITAGWMTKGTYGEIPRIILKFETHPLFVILFIIVS
jgi:hypothetical protein